MNFQFANLRNAKWLLPEWSIDADGFCNAFEKCVAAREDYQVSDPYAPMNYWVEVNVVTGLARFVDPDGGEIDHSGWLLINGKDDCYQIVLPLNAFLKSYECIEGMHSMYLHSLQTETPLAYVGITKRKWFTRYAEHQAHAAGGSRYFFHAALREHQSVKILHKVLLYGINLEQALHYEEEFVGMFGLYPVGLNMIPGGLAGLKYLAKLGIKHKTTEWKHQEIMRIMSRPSLHGRPNPLCSARWSNDKDYVERVICGHSGRLTVEQVRMTRNMSLTGRPVEEIAALVGAKAVPQVKRVLSGDTYSRIA